MDRSPLVMIAFWLIAKLGTSISIILNKEVNFVTDLG